MIGLTKVTIAFKPAATALLFVALAVACCSAQAADSAPLPDLPRGITSFGAAISQGDLYVYGGHWGSAHEYYIEGQSNELLKLSLKQPKAWEKLEGGPRTTGLALLAHGGKLYRVGGFQARNKEGEKQSLWSLADTAVYDPATNRWTSLPEMPAGRSSHDAAVLGDSLYVFGGWNMEGPDKTTWHTTGCVLDLKQPTTGWRVIDKVPFQRRALSVATHDGKLVVIGGMQKEGGPTTAVDIYNPQTGKWKSGPNLPGDKGMEGFGNSSIACGNELVATNHSGSIFKLSADEQTWQPLGKLEHPRFFHRLLAIDDSNLLAVGGAHMGTGKIVEVERVSIKPAGVRSAALPESKK